MTDLGEKELIKFVQKMASCFYFLKVSVTGCVNKIRIMTAL